MFGPGVVFTGQRTILAYAQEDRVCEDFSRINRAVAQACQYANGMGMMGPAGSCKTTIINLLVRFCGPEQVQKTNRSLLTNGGVPATIK